MNTQIEASPLIGFCVSFALMAVALGPMIVLVNSTPDEILEGKERESAKIADEECVATKTG
jgi:hypothetical protein